MIIEDLEAVHNRLHGFKEGYAAATGRDEPYILLEACNALADCINIIKELKQ